MGVLEEVRDRCHLVAGQASSVRIDHARLEAYAGELDLAGAAVGEPDPAHVRLPTVEATVAFVVALDAVNFGSGWFPVLRKRPGSSGYGTVAGVLRDLATVYGPPSAEELAGVTSEGCADLFGQERGSPAMELMAHFAEAWRQLGRLLLERYGGSPVSLVEAACGSAEALVGLVRVMPYWEDRRAYRGLDVPFYKRAQILAADLALAFGGEGLGRFDDLDRLTIFADNLVPHVLRVDGVLRLDPALEAAIAAGELVPEGSEAEVELRACAVDAVERLVALLGSAGRTEVTAARLDTFLWDRGSGAVYKSVPRHRTRTVSY